MKKLVLVDDAVWRISCQDPRPPLSFFVELECGGDDRPVDSPANKKKIESAVASLKKPERVDLMRAAREAVFALTPEERKQIFTETGLYEQVEFVKHLSRPNARVGALIGGLLGAALGAGADKDSDSKKAKK